MAIFKLIQKAVCYQTVNKILVQATQNVVIRFNGNFVVPSGIEPESRASETLILSIVLRDHELLTVVG